MSSNNAQTPEAALLDQLTGVRSGKRSYYPEYLRGAERLESAVRALHRISRALVYTADSPQDLVEAVVHAAAEHLHAEWVLFALADGVLQAAQPRHLLLFGERLYQDESLFPADVAAQWHTLRHRPWEAEQQLPGDPAVLVGMTLDGEPVGGIAACPALEVEVAETDLAIMNVLANQAAVALHNSFLVHATTELRGQTRQLSAAAERQAKDLASRSAELAETQRKLTGALRRQVLDEERHRIARELHDSVTQDVLSAGMTVEICRSELERAGYESGATLEQLQAAKDLTRRAVERLRTSIYALNNTADEPAGSLPVLLQRLSAAHLPGDLTVSVSIRGKPLALAPRAEHALLRVAGEALFNTANHSNAKRCAVRLHYHATRLVLTVSDDGDGDPATLRRTLSVTATTAFSGHRGLANMHARVEQLNGTLRIRRSSLGGVMLRVEIPLPAQFDDEEPE
ncbi:MadS family sensor histidine kinase [Sciscionella sediminilitoris]|uniref:MadS family sensor histidine kinase n=1 Tax=Sciscionella sediminilitoris TaxID=1445613 RepID=UPI0004DFA900